MICDWCGETHEQDILPRGEHSSIVNVFKARFKEGPVSTQEELLTKGFPNITHTPARWCDEDADWNCNGAFVHLRVGRKGYEAFPNGTTAVTCRECGYSAEDVEANDREYDEFVERTGRLPVNSLDWKEERLQELLREDQVPEGQVVDPVMSKLSKFRK